MVVMVPWTRLIRFVSSHDNEVHFGDVILPSDDFDIGLAHEAGIELTARLIHGNPLSSTCEVLENRIVSVKQLLGPFTLDMVPAIRCIGLNYAEHG
jgi:hypothetical protein